MSAVPSLWSLATNPGKSDTSIRKFKISAAPATAPRTNALSFFDAKSTELMRRFQGSNDEIAFQELYRLNAPRIARIVNSCLRYGAPDLTSDDIVQDVFVSVFRSAHRFRPDRENAFRYWSSQIARNAVRRALRDRRVREMHNSGAPLDYIPVKAETSAQSESVSEGCAAVPLLLLALAHAFEAQLPRDREILEETEMLNLRYEQIAVRRGMRHGTVRMVVFRARNRLFEKLESLLYPSRSTNG